MKISKMSFSLCGVATLLVTLPLSAELAMRDVATHDELSHRLRVANNQSPLVNHKPAEGADPSKSAGSGSLVSRSDFMSFAGRATLVPKRAILHVPASMADRIKLQTGSRIQNWADFYAVNQAWITTVEVNRLQAEGNEALAEDLLKRIQKSNKVIVATHQNGPISVLPLKVPTETANLPKP